jgi:hypothetical protein
MPAYFIVDNEVTDSAGFEEYRKQVPITVEKYGGRFLVRGGQIQTLDPLTPTVCRWGFVGSGFTAPARSNLQGRGSRHEIG